MKIMSTYFLNIFPTAKLLRELTELKDGTAMRSTAGTILLQI